MTEWLFILFRLCAEELIEAHSHKWDPPGPEQVVCPKAWPQSPLEGIADSILNHVHPASCTHAVPCQEARGGCRTRWQWSWPQNNWLSTRHPIIPCSHYGIPVFSCINALLKRTMRNRCLHLLFVNVEMAWDKKRALITAVDHNVGRKIHLKSHQLVSKTLCWKERGWGEDVFLNVIFFLLWQ